MTSHGRHSGRTQQMLEAALASDSSHVMVVAHTENYAMDLMNRAMAMLDETVETAGRKFEFTSVNSFLTFQKWRGRGCAAYVDHHVWEVTGPRTRDELRIVVEHLS